ncbi:FAD-dependent oxidoreductase [Brevundimonas kwangchunensis]|uniref:FAD-dependent oxidoreductase n=1 Tax=Brevundimonas kwangchunensis TaxID=322163 RepID=A0ABN1GWQ6_9CAUL
MSSPDVIVVGAGVLGLCAAAELAARGRSVTVLDPGGANASAAAAGMIAPALESLIDDLSPAHAALLARGRDLWPEFAGRNGLDLYREGAEWRGPDPDADLLRLTDLGFTAERRGEGVFAPDDWRVDAIKSLARLSGLPGVVRHTAQIASIRREGENWLLEADDGRQWRAPTVVIATGAAAALEGLPENVERLISAIRPIRGQLTPVRCLKPAQVIRVPGLYAAPTGDGALAGATMEFDDRSTAPDTDTAQRQAEGVLTLLGCEGVAGEPRVGVRGATADGLPMAGPAGVPGLHLGLAPRRNGWLLGPMVGRIVADGIEGEASLPDTPALDPLRFA